MFKFNGKSTDDFSIIIEEELNLLKRASIKYEATDIPGKDGSNYEEQGFSDVEIPIKLQLLDISRLPDIYSWLNGQGILEYNNKKTTARIYTEHEPIRFGRIYTIDISIIRSPFWYKSDDNFTLIENTANNDGNIFSQPIIRLEKTNSESVEITVNGTRFKYNFQEDNYVEFDCETCDAVMNGQNRNQSIEIDFEIPTLNPGVNNIIINVGECIVKMKKKDRFL